MVDGIWGSTEFISAIVGAVIGTIGGGLISFGLQTSSTRSARRAALEDRRERETAMARALLLKISYLYSDVARVKDHLEAGIAMRLDVEGAPYWATVKPLANIPQTLTNITADEVALLLPLGNDGITNAIISCDRMRGAVVELIQHYSEMRMALAEKLTPSPPGPNGQGAIFLDDMRKFAREMFELDQLIKDTTALSREYEVVIGEALHGAHTLLRQKYSIGFDLGTPSKPLS